MSMRLCYPSTWMSSCGRNFMEVLLLEWPITQIAVLSWYNLSLTLFEMVFGYITELRHASY